MWQRVCLARIAALAALVTLAWPAQSSPTAPEDEDEAADAGASPENNAPAGRYVDAYATVPTTTPACSLREPVCVRATAELGTRSVAVLRVLAASERAYRSYVDALGWPRVEPGARLDLVLHANAERVVDGPRDMLAAFDRGAMTAWLDARDTTPCALESQAARAVASQLLARASPALDDTSRRARSTALAALVEPCVDTMERPARDALLRDHARGIVQGDTGIDVFYTWLDNERGTHAGATLLALGALIGTSTPAGAAAWTNEPDTFDALRRTFQGALYKEEGEGGLYTDFAVWRSTGARYDEHALDAHGTWPAAARAFRSRVPLAPTGAAYLAFDASGAQGARLRIEASWETHAKMAWLFVRLDASQNVLSIQRVAQLARATDCAATSEPIGDARTLLIVGVHTGHPVYQLDPDDGDLEPHGWELRVQGL